MTNKPPVTYYSILGRTLHTEYIYILHLHAYNQKVYLITKLSLVASRAYILQTLSIKYTCECRPQSDGRCSNFTDDNLIHASLLKLNFTRKEFRDIVCQNHEHINARRPIVSRLTLGCYTTREYISNWIGTLKVIIFLWSLLFALRWNDDRKSSQEYSLKFHVLTDVSVAHLPDSTKSPTRSTFSVVCAVRGP